MRKSTIGTQKTSFNSSKPPVNFSAVVDLDLMDLGLQIIRHPATPRSGSLGLLSVHQYEEVAVVKEIIFKGRCIPRNKFIFAGSNHLTGASWSDLRGDKDQN